MSRATVELDFVGIMERDNSNASKSQFQKFLHRQRSFRGTQNAIAKINPEILKTVIASAGITNKNAGNGSVSVPTSPSADRITFPSLPVYVPNARLNSEPVKETTSLTIFYNGCVTVFDVTHDKAESILKMATTQETKSFKAVESVAVDSRFQTMSPLTSQSELVKSLDGDLPLARRKSLQRFLEKRKERMISVSPYGSHT